MKSRSIELWLVAALFVGPLLLAVVLYFGPFDTHSLPRLEAEGRELFEPPLALPPGALERAAGAPRTAAWSLIYATMAPCDEACAGELARLAAVEAALGRRAARVQRILLAPGAAAPAADPGLLTGPLEPGDELLRVLGEERVRGGGVFVVDPLGNVVLAYPPGAAQKDLLEDLQRLLQVSRIG